MGWGRTGAGRAPRAAWRPLLVDQAGGPGIAGRGWPAHLTEEGCVPLHAVAGVSSLDLRVERAHHVVQHLDADVIPPHTGACAPRALIRGLEDLEGPEPGGAGFPRISAAARQPGVRGACPGKALVPASELSQSFRDSVHFQSKSAQPARLSLTPQDEKGPVLVLPHLGTRRSCASCSVGTATAACLLCTLPSGSTVEKPRVSKDKADHSPGSPIPQSRGPPPLGRRTVPVHGP